MFTRSKHIAPRAIPLLAAILSTALAQPVPAQISTVVDPVGDTSFPAPAFQDIVLGQMTKTASGDFELLMEMAGRVLVAPRLPPPARSEIWWNFVFDLDPATSPAGYPVAPGSALYPEVIVYVSWDGIEFAGTAVDRRPLITGGEAIITPVPFTISGATVEAFLDFTLIGEVPPSFRWRTVTVDWAGPLGSNGFVVPDNTDAIFDASQPGSNTTGELQLASPAAPSNCHTRTSTWRDGKGHVWSFTFVSWRDNSRDEDGFIVEEWSRNQAGAWALGWSVSVPANSTSIAGHTGPNFKYRVKAFNASGDSSWSNWGR